MAESLMVFEGGERLCTLGEDGEARVFEVQDDGSLILVAGPKESI
jgi:hypothetical protein